MRILLLQPPVWKTSGFKNPSNTGLGLLYIGAVLRKAGHEVRIIDTQAACMWYEDIMKVIEEWKPTHIGIGTMISNIKSGIILSGMIKEKHPDIWITFGGAGVSCFPDYTFKKSKCDSVVVGEGELVAERAFNERGIIQGIQPENLDNLPNPAFDLLEPMVGSDLWPGQPPRPYPFSMKMNEVSLMWSRGCPHTCIFCSKASVKRGPTRMRSPKNIIDEIEYLHTKFGVNSFTLVDDELMGMSEAHNKWITSVLEEIKKWNYEGGRKIPKAFFKGLGRCSKKWVTEEIVRAFKEAGFYHMSMGCESGSDRIKKVIKKNLTNEDILSTLPLIHNAGITMETFWMIGIIEETEDDARATARLVAKVSKYSEIFQCLPFTAFPGSELFDMAIENGWLLPGVKPEDRDEAIIDAMDGRMGDQTLLVMPWMSPPLIKLWQDKLYHLWTLSREVWELARNDFL